MAARSRSKSSSRKGKGEKAKAKTTAKVKAAKNDSEIEKFKEAVKKVRIAMKCATLFDF